ncbi:right-handed parallel beta-helix repeat-containing protein [Cohnella sp. JJ-181]|uniref:right-handed parallel beta-helix repeat-containing protein n=1 Tax=Cohnella rhizoplanae TaxID=2974897 RepID=UPI0022FFB79F|nr:right-handed parallel beta-helix repeat-containing protein [Cohnella sp. JJ-181]CAI6077452.1 hypothetical protein COHCIP112018_02583 [Cohnella sp. JJ-181]
MKKFSSMASALVLALGVVYGYSSLTDKPAYAASSTTTQVFSAAADFGTVQGEHQWFYQKLVGTAYTDLAYSAANKRWQPANSDYPWVSKDKQHPDGNADSVLKWVSPAKGTIAITGEVTRAFSEGDGIVVTVLKDSKMLWKNTLTFVKGYAPKSVGSVPVEKGTAIYFIVSRNKTAVSDEALWSPTIELKSDAPVQTAAPTATATPTPAPSATPSPTATPAPIITSAPSATPAPIATPAPSATPAPTAAPAATPAPTATPAAAGIDVTSCGATADDGKDDYAAFVSCLSKAKTQGKPVTVPAGNFTLGKILTLDGVSLSGAGMDKTTLTSTDPLNGSIDIKGNGVTLSGIKHAYATTVPRGNGANEKNSITVRSATNFVIDRVYVYKSSTAGILVTYDAKGGRITNNVVDSTGADGIHITNGSSDITIEGNLVKGVGDDTIAVVSYGQDRPAVNHVTIRNNDVGYGSLARGISVVGGTDVLIEANSVKETMMAGIYIACEGSYNTANVSNVTVKGNTIDHTGIQEPQNHPNVLVYASTGMIDNVAFTGNTIKNAAHRGIGVWGDGQIKDIYFTGNTLINDKGANTTFKNGTIHLLDNIGF